MTNSHDMGIFDQSLWNTLHGNFFYTSILNKSLLKEHSFYILFLILPIYIVLPTPLALLVLQVVVLGLAGLLLYMISLELLKYKGIAICVTVAFLCSNYLVKAMLYDFHPEVLFTLFIFSLFLCVLKEKYILYYISMFLLLSVKESALVYVSFIGLYWIVRRKYRLASITILSSILWAIFIFVIVPSIFNRSSDIAFYSLSNRYIHLGKNALEILKTLVLRPDIVIKYLIIPQKLITLAKLFSTVLFMPFFSPLSFLLITPPLAVHLLSNNTSQYSLAIHHCFSVLPFLYIGTVYGMKNISRKFSADNRKKVLFILAIIIMFVSLKDRCFWKHLYPRHVVISQHHRLGKDVLKLIPEDASVSAQNCLVPHLSHRKLIFEFPTINDAEYVVGDEKVTPYGMTENEFSMKIQAVLDNNDYKTIFLKDGYLLLKKVH